MRLRGGRTAWVDDPTFDVREHVRAVPVAEPFSHEDLRRFCARTMEERLDRSRPLWTIDVLAPFEEGSKSAHDAALRPRGQAIARLLDGLDSNRHD